MLNIHGGALFWIAMFETSIYSLHDDKLLQLGILDVHSVCAIKWKEMHILLFFSCGICVHSWGPSQ